MYTYCRFAKFLLWIHDHQMLSGEVQQEENLGIYIMIRSGLQSEPFQFVDFTDYVLKTVTTCGQMRCLSSLL